MAKYAEEEHILAQMSGLVEGLTNQGLPTLQQNRTYPGGAKQGSSLCECAINPTHCFRTVSQRSLTVNSTFMGRQTKGPPNIAIGADIFTELFRDSAQGCAPGTIVFNDANNNDQRKKINNLVLFALRCDINVLLLDGNPAGPGSIDVSNLQARLQEVAYHYFNLEVFHTSDTNDPWIDKTPLSYFKRPAGEFVLIPPVKWIDRDPTMQLSFQGGQFGAGAGFPPQLTSSTRAFEGQASMEIETLWMPDPNICPDVWPGEICPRDMIANTPEYVGKISSARRMLQSIVK